MTKSRSLSKMSLSSAGSANYHLHRELSYSLEDSEDDDDDESEMNVIYSPALLREPSPDEVPPEVRSKFMTKAVVMIIYQTDLTFVIKSLFKCKAIKTKIHYTSIS